MRLETYAGSDSHLNSRSCSNASGVSLRQEASTRAADLRLETVPTATVLGQLLWYRRRRSVFKISLLGILSADSVQCGSWQR